MTNNNEKHCEPNCDYKNYVRKGRADLRCKDCDRDLTLELVLMAELKDNSSPTQSVEEKEKCNIDYPHSCLIFKEPVYCIEKSIEHIFAMPTTLASKERKVKSFISQTITKAKKEERDKCIEIIKKDAQQKCRNS